MKGHPLKVWLAQNDLKSNDLCDMAGISRSYLSLIVNGKRWPEYNLAKKLSIMTGIQPEVLITWNRE